MLDPGNPNYRLQDLVQRWATDPESRIYQQLAEEYRKAGQVEKAAQVLEDGLSRRPRDVGGHVALGKCRLELGQPAEAVRALDQVIVRDPAHHVANKLLIEAHLQAGDAWRASERLDIYRLLNDRDPEIEHFTFRLRQLGGETSEKEVLETTEETLPLATSIETLAAAAKDKSGFAGHGAVGDGSTPTEGEQMTDRPSRPSGDIFALDAPPEDPGMESLLQQVASVRHGSTPGPFSTLLGQPIEGQSVLQEGGGALFPQVLAPPAQPRVPSPPATVAEPEPIDVAPEPVVAVEPELVAVEPEPIVAVAPEPVAVEPEPIVAVEPEPVAVDPEPIVAVAPEPVAIEAMEGATDDPLETGIAPSLLRRKIDELAPTQPLPTLELEEKAPTVGRPFPGLSVPGKAIPEPPLPEPAISESASTGREEDLDSIELMETSPVLPAVGFEAEDAAVMGTAVETGGESGDEETGATVTLGNLYLRQGHFDEAARIFEQILVRDPENMAAHQGLATARPETDREARDEAGAGLEPVTEAAPSPPSLQQPLTTSEAGIEPVAVESPEAPAVQGELTAARLLADRSLAGTIPDSKTARTVLVLSNYLKHLKTARERHDVQ